MHHLPLTEQFSEGARECAFKPQHTL
jgi:hypothetical protein